MLQRAREMMVVRLVFEKQLVFCVCVCVCVCIYMFASTRIRVIGGGQAGLHIGCIPMRLLVT